jgi:hypothetical protein
MDCWHEARSRPVLPLQICASFLWKLLQDCTQVWRTFPPTPGARGMPTPPRGTRGTPITGGICWPTLRPLPCGVAPTAKTKARQSNVTGASFLMLGISGFITPTGNLLTINESGQRNLAFWGRISLSAHRPCQKADSRCQIRTLPTEAKWHR